VEETSRDTDMAVADRFFAASEAACIRRCPPDNRQSRFYDFWTLKESYIKARGKGLAIDLTRFAFHLCASTIAIDFHPSLGDSPGNWRFFRFSPVEHYTAAVTVRSSTKGRMALNTWRCLPFRSMELVSQQVSEPGE
jgi:4'-phosphopantetheinyl transferase